MPICPGEKRRVIFASSLGTISSGTTSISTPRWCILRGIFFPKGNDTAHCSRRSRTMRGRAFPRAHDIAMRLLSTASAHRKKLPSIWA